MKLYHGTNLSSAFNICIYGVDITKSLKYLDFGSGFYMTDNKNKAIQRAIKKTNDYNKRYGATEVPYIVEVIIDESLFQNYNVKKFKDTGLEWCEFVTYNRFDMSYLNDNHIINHNVDKKYDIVCGEIADGKIANIISDVKAGRCNLDEIDFSQYFTESGKSYGFQVSLHTEKAISCITAISCDIIRNRNKGKNNKRKKLLRKGAK